MLDLHSRFPRHKMKRREFITHAGSLAAFWPLAARADRVARIGYLSPNPASTTIYEDAFLAGLRDFGYFNGKNIHIDFRFADGHDDRLPALAIELVNLNVDIIVTYGTGNYAVKRATQKIPIVLWVAADMVAMGMVSSLAHPGGNITGQTFFVPELMAKRLELLKEIVPSLSRCGILFRRNVPSTAYMLEVMAAPAKALGIDLKLVEVAEAGEFERVFSAWADEKIEALLMQDVLVLDAASIANLAAKYRLPSIGPVELPTSGGLIGYGVNFADMARRSAAFVDKILKGGKAGDIPIEQATKFTTVINLKTAKALGVNIPPTLFVSADEVIE
jgi:putative ABC transport system substrate-binding protein